MCGEMNINNGNGDSYSSQDKTIINRIMQRFRPIAPKPVPEGSDVSSVTAELVQNQRRKRKYVRVQKNNKSRISKAEGKGDRTVNGFVDAFLSPTGVIGSKEIGSFTVWAFTPEQPPKYTYPLKSVSTYSVRNMSDLAEGTPSRKVVESWLVIDGMTVMTCPNVTELGNSDKEKMRNLELDTCPGLISDGDHRVQWINHAYRKMVERDENKEDALVNLVLKQKIPHICRAFTCSVRVMYNKYSQIMPCDVWKMDFGGFAWRLDAAAALKLGR